MNARISSVSRVVATFGASVGRGHWRSPRKTHAGKIPLPIWLVCIVVVVLELHPDHRVLPPIAAASSTCD
jgi:hypothetical protein